MPDYASTTIHFESADDCTKARSIAETADWSFDLSAIKPMPASLDIPESEPTNGDAILCYLTDKGERKRKPRSNLARHFDYCFRGADSYADKCAKIKALSDAEKEKRYNLGKLLCGNYENYGFTTWYGWCNKHWNTKWNAFDVIWGDDYVAMSTAWAPPTPVIQELSNRIASPLRACVIYEYGPEIYGVKFSPDAEPVDCGRVGWEHSCEGDGTYPFRENDTFDKEGWTDLNPECDQGK